MGVERLFPRWYAEADAIQALAELEMLQEGQSAVEELQEDCKNI